MATNLQVGYNQLVGQVWSVGHILLTPALAPDETAKDSIGPGSDYTYLFWLPKGGRNLSPRRGGVIASKKAVLAGTGKL